MLAVWCNNCHVSGRCCPITADVLQTSANIGGAGSAPEGRPRLARGVWAGGGKVLEPASPVVGCAGRAQTGPRSRTRPQHQSGSHKHGLSCCVLNPPEQREMARLSPRPRYCREAPPGDGPAETAKTPCHQRISGVKRRHRRAHRSPTCGLPSGPPAPRGRARLWGCFALAHGSAVASIRCRRQVSDDHARPAKQFPALGADFSGDLDCWARPPSGFVPMFPKLLQDSSVFWGQLFGAPAALGGSTRGRPRAARCHERGSSETTLRNGRLKVGFAWSGCHRRRIPQERRRSRSRAGW